MRSCRRAWSGVAKVDPNAKSRGRQAHARADRPGGVGRRAREPQRCGRDRARRRRCHAGKSAIKKLFQKRVDAHVRATAAGQVTASVTADGELAWVTVPVVRSRTIPIRCRCAIFAVYEKAGSDWKMIALQESTRDRRARRRRAVQDRGRAGAAEAAGGRPRTARRRRGDADQKEEKEKA